MNTNDGEAPNWRFPVEPNQDGDVFEVHVTPERLQQRLLHNPKLVPCSHESPADLTKTDVQYFHLDACELYDDYEHYLQYKCLNCGTKYDVWIPDC